MEIVKYQIRSNTKQQPILVRLDIVFSLPVISRLCVYIGKHQLKPPCTTLQLEKQNIMLGRI